MRFLLYNYYFLALTIAQVFCECGRTDVRVKSLVAYGFPAEIGTFPWHVGIHRVDWESGEIDQICGGSLITSDLVISAAHCFYDEDEGRMNDPLEYAVVVGKIQRSYYEIEDAEQKSQVKWIHVPFGYNGLRGNYANDIAVVHLRHSFAETQFVSPVCIDWRSRYVRAHLRNGNIGKVTGWGITEKGIPSEELQKIDLPYIDRDYCRRGAPEDFVPFVTNDKICAGYLNGSSVCKGDSGGGYCFQSDGRWYLRGVVSVNASPGNGTCNDNYYSGFTNVGHYLDWIGEFLHDAERDSTIVEYSTTGSCSLPEQPEGGRFEQHSFGKSSDRAAGSRVPIDSVLIYRCNENCTLRGNDYSICKDEGWTPLPTCVKTCPALKLANGDILCKYNGEIVSCESAMAPGTRATLECNNYYNITPVLEEITCLDEGVWTSSGFQCVPECGKAESMETPLIVNGSPVMHGSFPWLVIIYHTFRRNLRRMYVGTLIKPDLIVCRAHFLHDNYGLGRATKNELAVYAGRYHVSSYKLEPYVQTSIVKKIQLHPNSAGYIGNNAYDIALLHLETPFTMSKLVRPVCLDRKSIFAEGFPEVVKMPGWNSGIYCEVGVRFLNRASCLPFVSSSFHEYLSSDKVCFQQIGNVYPEDDPDYRGGIYAEKNNTWYLVGVPNIEDYSTAHVLFATNLDTLRSFILEAERD